MLNRRQWIASLLAAAGIGVGCRLPTAAPKPTRCVGYSHIVQARAADEMGICTRAPGHTNPCNGYPCEWVSRNWHRPNSFPPYPIYPAKTAYYFRWPDV